MPGPDATTTVAVTGAGGLIGRALVAALAEHEAVAGVVAVDRVPLDDLPAGAVARRADVRDPRELRAAFAGADAVVHLAFQVDPLHDEAAMRAVNVDGSRHVAEQAEQAGCDHLVVVSSATAYGAHRDNPVPLRESAPLRAPATFPYAHHKAEVEGFIADWGAADGRPLVTVLRPAIVTGPGVDNFITAQLDAPRFPVVKGHAPPFQFVHLDDVVAAMVHVVTRRVAGTFNVASEGWLSLDEVTAILGRRRVDVPEEVAHGLADVLWRLHLSPSPAGQLPYVMYPWIVDVSALVATGWQPRHSNRDALAALAAEHVDRVAFGPLRGSRRALRRGGAGVAVAAGAWVASRAIRAWTRRRSRGEASGD